MTPMPRAHSAPWSCAGNGRGFRKTLIPVSACGAGQRLTKWETGVPWFNRLMEYRSKDEWPWTVDAPYPLASGWRPHPFSEFVVRIHSRPDWSSDYCYLYGMADQSWR